MTGHSARASIVAMVGAMGAFVVNDALVKYASQSMPGAQLIFVRGVMALALVLVAAWRMGTMGRIGEIARGWVAARAVIDAAATVLFLVALFHLPISSVTAINMTSPLMITILAAVFLGERVGFAPWLATVAGFGGVLLIVKPQTGSVDAYAALCFTGTVLLSIRDLITQRVHASIPSILITLSNVAALALPQVSW
jgi:drug/metabolite transporter (DMT)-like permease